MMARRLRLLRWPVDDRGVEQDRRRHARPEPELLGRQAEARQGRVPVRARHRSRVPGVQERRGRHDLPAAADRRRRADQRRHRRRNSSFTDETGNFESLWLNNAAFPFDSVAVRQALAYAIDRDAIVEALFGGLGVDEPLQTLNAPILSFFSDTEAFAGYTLDLDKVDELMTGDGWAKNGDGIWAKDGKTATFVLNTTAGNKRRELTQQIVQEQLARPASR